MPTKIEELSGQLLSVPVRDNLTSYLPLNAAKLENVISTVTVKTTKHLANIFKSGIKLKWIVFVKR